MKKEDKKNKELNDYFNKILKDNSNINFIYNMVKDKMNLENENDFFLNHILPCTKVCFVLGQERNENLESCVIAGLLHDFGKYFLTKEEPDHEIVGSKLANEILNSIGYSKEETENISAAIFEHKLGIRANSTHLQNIVADADAISYILYKPYFYNYLLKNNLSKTKANETMKAKVEDCFEKMSNIMEKTEESIVSKYGFIKDLKETQMIEEEEMNFKS